MKALVGKVAVVTGASRGIGRAIAVRLAQDGAAVVVNFVRRVDEAKRVVAQIEAEGGAAIAVQADVSHVPEVRRLFRETVERYGRVDIVVANAGIFEAKPLTDVSEEEYDRFFNLNAKGTFFTLQEAARHVGDGGRIIYISTDGTAMRFPGGSLYVGSKAAGEQFVKSLAMELGPRGITVNTISPGYTETDMLTSEELRTIGIQMSPLGRLGHPSDIAEVVAFVANPQGQWLTGQNVHAGGGVVM